ncbi:RING-H2 finger protein ATL39-like [Miscanthus floridulus]|uniref:RING-H2 finger protein ATL39-like n=1 Tax=Miscanthus floridulus TaxID=154761 RepID=UPI00345B096C
MSVMSTVDLSPGTPPPSPPPPPGHRGCCTSGATLELVGAFTAVCLVLYGVILYMNYLYVRWSGRDGVHRTDSGAGLPARKRPAGGIDKAALAAMPVLRFKADAHGGGGDSPMECAVCLSAMQDGDTVRALPGCRHAFHVACVDAWLCARATCPVCRARPALPPPQQAPKAGAKVPGSSGRQPDLDLESQV